MAICNSPAVPVGKAPVHMRELPEPDKPENEKSTVDSRGEHSGAKTQSKPIKCIPYAEYNSIPAYKYTAYVRIEAWLK